jgi:hypothetical protein
MDFNRGQWCGGLSWWVEGETAFISVAFTWRLPEAYSRAVWYRSQGYKVVAGGPGIFTQKKYLAGVAEIGKEYPDAVAKQNPQATFASRGCPVGCWFCIVPKMEGRDFSLLPDFPVRPVLCDNNLSALPADFQDHIVSRYQAEGVPLLDANSGFEPRTFDEEVLRRWSPINKGPWRFAYDDQGDGPHVERVLKMLKDVNPRKKQVYVLIGNEPMADCIDRVNRVIAWGGEPYAQAFIKLNALTKTPHVRHDWTPQGLINLKRWTNSRIWRAIPFEEYRTKFQRKAQRPERNPGQMEMGEI